MVVSIPVKDSVGNVNGILVGQYDMKKIMQVVENVAVDKKGEVFLVDRNGLIVAGSYQDKLVEPTRRLWGNDFSTELENPGSDELG